MELTKSELEVMNVIWKANRPLSRNEILTMSSHKTWKDSSIHILLNGLLKKEAIIEAGFTRSGKTWGRLYAANISCEEYYATNIFAPGGKEVLPLLFSALISSDNLTVDMVDELENMLKKRRQELSN
jgi:BlaI family penicillinase repressor